MRTNKIIFAGAMLAVCGVHAANADIASTSYVATSIAAAVSGLNLGALASKSDVSSVDINNGTIMNIDISDNAAIAKSKLEAGVQASLGKADSAAGAIGTLENLATTKKSTLVEAINEVKDNAVTSNSISDMETKTNAATTYAAKSTETVANNAGTAAAAAQATANAAVVANNAITAGTGTKITYDEKGLVTKGENLAESDIPVLSISKITDLGNTLSGKQSATTTDDSGKVLVGGSTAGTFGTSITLGGLATAAPGTCANTANKCVLTFDGTNYAWEIIER